MWSEICNDVPFIVGATWSIEHDIEEYKRVAEAQRIKNNYKSAEFWENAANELIQYKQNTLDKMSKREIRKIIRKEEQEENRRWKEIKKEKRRREAYLDRLFKDF